MTNAVRAPPDQPRHPEGPEQPRSTTACSRSYSILTSTLASPSMWNSTLRYSLWSRSARPSRKVRPEAVVGTDAGPARQDRGGQRYAQVVGEGDGAGVLLRERGRQRPAEVRQRVSRQPEREAV